MTTPTEQVCHDLQRAYIHFNRELFGGKLPSDVVLSYQREGQSFGFLRRRQYLHLSRRETHEISLNPRWISQRSLTESLATLVHIMCRLHHSLLGMRHSRSSYHNRELAGYLKRTGLLPRVDGDPNGKETGCRVTLLIEDGGPFDIACQKLLAEGFAFAWVDRVPGELPSGIKSEAACTWVRNMNTLGLRKALSPAKPLPATPEPVYAPIQDKLANRPERSAGLRRKYQCPGCLDAFWAGYGIQAQCVRCKRLFIDTDPTTAKTRCVKRKRRRSVPHTPPGCGLR